MTWTAPLTAVANTALSAAQWNASVRDNFAETAPGKATTAGYHFVSTGTNAIAERAILGAVVDTSQTTASTTYTDLATIGPTVTITTGTQALVWISCQVGQTTANQTCTTYIVTGATTVTASDNVAIVSDTAAGTSSRFGVCNLQALTAGSNVFTMQYRVLTAGTGTFLRRRIQVMAL